ncbi:GNAT family N-acetyltransferase [Mesorhizobium sp. RP14(2022)]|jgi:[ribosomal protein S5]-alanine N-acetyltransferase|uniref:GNAT family N-acetyltransferase n=1 Tax=Mesorhizobium liriopis TaxID=2953882 RepID=A0ABT1C156_9HYPH|nr:GNAT family protein [Mesorhizobium liriopis]MCO6048559.1 GNAT family N-acetyltransferase [Mesorhizobium liriopis]
MWGLPSFSRPEPELVGDRVVLRPPRTSDYRQWASLRRDSRAFLEPWEPRWAPDELERASWRQRLRRYRQDQADGTALAFLIFDRKAGHLIGGITLGNIRHGVSQSAHIGYWVGERFAGQGFMVDAVRLVAQYSFERLRLHRLEAACIPTNNRSARVLEKAGFQREGLLRSFLRINGAWHDHILFSLIAGDSPSDASTRKG